MIAFELLYFLQGAMKSLSDCDIKMDDYRHICMYLEFKEMLFNNEKKEYIKSSLAEKYHMSESSVVRVIRRFDRPVKS